MIKRIKKLYSYEFIRYSIWWWLAALIDLWVLRFCTDVCQIYYLFSAIIAFLVSFSFWYFFQKYLTFKNHSKKHLQQGSLFLIFQLFGQWIYMGVLRIWVDQLGRYYLLVAILGKGIAFIRNYLSNHFFNFKE